MNDTDLATRVRDAVRDTHMTVPESDITRRARSACPASVTVSWAARSSPPVAGSRRKCG
jgi:hypothetical protein